MVPARARWSRPHSAAPPAPTYWACPQGQPAAVTDLLGGRIDFVAADLGAVLPQIRARNLNAVALVSAKRSTILSSVPTAGTGMGSLDLTGWIGVAGPAGLTPEAAAWWSGHGPRCANPRCKSACVPLAWNRT